MIVHKTALGLKSHVINKICVNYSSLNIYSVFSFSANSVKFSFTSDLFFNPWKEFSSVFCVIYKCGGTFRYLSVVDF